MARAESFSLYQRYLYRSDQIGMDPFHAHPEYEVYYFHSGICEYYIGDRVYSLQPGDLIIMNGITQHFPKTDASVEYVRSMLRFHPSFVQLLNRDFGTFNPLKPFEVLKNHHIRLGQGPQAQELESILHRMDRFQHASDDVGFNRYLAAFLDLLMFVYEVCEPRMKEAPAVSAVEHSAQRIIDYIEYNYLQEDVSIESMAELLHFNKTYMQKVFQKVTGMTVFEYLNRRRIQQSKIMFHLNREQSITEICHQVGFKNLSHFSRLFKQHVGMSPDRYRQKFGMKAQQRD